jgi:hypothetical protein
MARAPAPEETKESMFAVRIFAAIRDCDSGCCGGFGMAEQAWMVYAWGEAFVVGYGDGLGSRG